MGYLVIIVFFILITRLWFSKIAPLASTVGVVLLTQISLGIMNVVYTLPLYVAIAHNLVAAMLLLVTLTVSMLAWKKMINLKAYYELCKPNVVLTMLVTALVGSLLASEVSYINFELILTSLIGIGLCACSAAAINQVIDRKIDANMSRTKGRPLPTGEIPIFNAIVFSLL